MIRKTTDKSRGIRLGNYVQIRTIEDEELEQVWAGKKTRQGSAGRDRQARQRTARALREGQQGLRPLLACGRPDGTPPALPAKRGGASRARSWPSKSASLPSWWLPWVLVAPQMVVIAGVLLLAGRPGAVAVACSSPTPSAPRSSGSGWTTSATCGTTRPTSRRSRPPRCSRCWWPSLGLSLSLLLAVFADRVVKGAGIYKTLLIWPYAVAPAVAGVLWLFMFAPCVGVVSLRAARRRHRLEPPAQRQPRDDADRDGRGVEADLLQLPVLPGRAAVDPEDR